MSKILLLMVAGFFSACVSKSQQSSPPTFGDDLAFLEKHTEVLVLSDASGNARVAVVPRYQGRVMTSTLAGAEGSSLGWINREHIASGKIVPHINVYGGEDRFWLGPEGGQFSIFFKKGVAFDLENWFTPAAIDTEPFELVSSSQEQALFRKAIQLENYSGTRFDLEVRREIRLLKESDITAALGFALDPAIRAVAFHSANTIANTGSQAWKKETGLLSIWILGMFTPTPATTVVVPFNQAVADGSVPVVNDVYFGKVPSERLAVKDGVIYFSGDGKYRSKIGLAPARAKSVLGSYDASNQVLTLVQYNQPEGVTDYVNSLWKIQDDPYAGDAVNSYNDGPPAPGAKPLGPFYELETSSPAAALKQGESLSHLHRTLHFQGPEEKLDAIAQKTLGVTIAKIKTALP
jgi:hypothetical protein